MLWRGDLGGTEREKLWIDAWMTKIWGGGEGDIGKFVEEGKEREGITTLENSLNFKLQGRVSQYRHK